MKKNLLGLAAIVLAIAVSSFTSKKLQDVYLVYNSGTQSDITNYSQTSTTQIAIDGTDVLAWLKVSDDNGIVTPTEFTPKFNAFDTNSNGTLNDQVENHSTIELREQ